MQYAIGWIITICVLFVNGGHVVGMDYTDGFLATIISLCYWGWAFKQGN